MRLKRNLVSITKIAIILLTISIFIVFLFNYFLNNDDTYPKKDWHNYEQIAKELKSRGPGEQGRPVVLFPALDKKIVEKIYRVNGYNGLISDKIATNRSIKDIRHRDCKTQLYQAQLPTVSIIIPFFEEHFSILLRTFTSVLNRSPAGLIKEIILIDDFSTKPFLKDELDNYVTTHHKGVIRILRNSKREGLIRTRLKGALNATGDILVFLDSHCESNVNWLPPLIDPIASDYKTVVCPFIDIIDYETFEYRAQDEGARGSFDWDFNYKRLPLLASDLEQPSRPFSNPVMAGGLFAISARWFWQLGGYDNGLDIWGGEQYELSFKIWQCGGRIVDAPCSRVGHIYRLYPPFPALPQFGNYIPHNYKRVAEVWMDEYKKFIYKNKEFWKNQDAGDFSAQIALRKRLKCKSFKWFMTEVAFDLVKFYPTVIPPNSAVGEIRSTARNSDGRVMCIEGNWAKIDSHMRLEPCLKDKGTITGNQLFVLSWHEDLRFKDREECLDVPGLEERAPVIVFTCHGGRGNQLWKYLSEKKQLFHVSSRKCLTANGATGEVFMETCGETDSQMWLLENVNEDVIKKYNRDLIM